MLTFLAVHHTFTRSPVLDLPHKFMRASFSGFTTHIQTKYNRVLKYVPNVYLQQVVKGVGGEGGQNQEKMAAILPELYTKYKANLQAIHTEDPHT